MAEALVLRGLLPADFERPSRFVFVSTGTTPPPQLRLGWVSPAGDPPDEGTLPALVGRRAAVATALELLDEAAARLVPWDWHVTPHRVVLVERGTAGAVLASNSNTIERALLALLGQKMFFSDVARGRSQQEMHPGERRARGSRSFAEMSLSPSHNFQAAHTLAACAMWRACADLGLRLPADVRLPGLPQRARFAEVPCPFDPLVDVMRLGLGCRTCHPTDPGDGPHTGLMLVVPVTSSP